MHDIGNGLVACTVAEMSEAASATAVEPHSSREDRTAALRRRIAACESIIERHLAQTPCTATAPQHPAVDSDNVGRIAQWFQLAPDAEVGETGIDSGDPPARNTCLGFDDPPSADEKWYNLALAADRMAFVEAASPERIQQVAEALREQKRTLVQKTVAITLARSQLRAQLGNRRRDGVSQGWLAHDAAGSRRKAVAESGSANGNGVSSRSVSRQF